MRRDTHDAALRCLQGVQGNGIEQGSVRLGPPEGLAGRIQCGHAAFRNQEAHRALHAVEPLGNPLPDARVLLRGGAHQRHVGVVNVEQALLESFRHRIKRPEVHHVECATRSNVGQGAAYRCPQAVVARAQHSAAQQVGDLGGGQVYHRGQVAVPGQLFQALAAGAGGMEHKAFEIGLQRLRDALHTCCSHAEHRQTKGRQCIGRGRLPALHHAGHGVRGIGQHLARDAVQARHIDHRVQHGDVRAAHIGSHVARGQCTDQQFGQAYRQAAHGRADQRRRAGAAGADHAGQVGACVNE